MGQVFGESLVQTPCCEYLLQSVLQRLGSTETHAPQYLALMDCISYLVQSWQQLYARYAEVTIARAMNAVFEVLYDAKCYEITDGGTEPPRWDIIGCSLDMIATVIGVLQEHSRQLVATVCVTLDTDVIKELKLDKPTGYIPDMINLCCQCADATVLQNVFALLGDVAWQCADLVATETVIASLNLNLLNPSKIVSNNVCWALGVISHTEHGKQRIESVVHEFYPKLVSILVTETESMILQNVCITIGYFAAGYPAYVGANLQQFLEPWLRNISRSSSEHDKANALVSMAQVVLNTAQVPQGALAAITRVILECPPWCKELDITLHALAQRLSLNPVEWNFLQDSEKAKLRERTI
uniref:Transportin, putative n=1 Tax=Babesia bovis TaxID=5865 RepID=S6C9U5_BABBO|nr:transportin, putative [Babesia bovis]